MATWRGRFRRVGPVKPPEKGLLERLYPEFLRDAIAPDELRRIARAEAEGQRQEGEFEYLRFAVGAWPSLHERTPRTPLPARSRLPGVLLPYLVVDRSEMDPETFNVSLAAGVRAR
jgi:hypothetical protein